MRHLLSTALLLAAIVPASADDWPQWMGPNRDGIWRETGIVEKLPAGGPRILWRVPINGGYAGPAVASGKVFVTDYQRTGGDAKNSPTVASESKGKERILALDAKTGATIWKHEYDCDYKVSYPCGPRCTPTVDGDRVYALGSMGNLVCLNATDGKVIWSKDFKKDYDSKTPLWGFAGHPLVDGDRLICLVGGKDSVVVAFDKKTGAERWKALSATETGYCPPTLIQAGGTRQLILWHGEAINGLDPATGKVYWSAPLKPNYGMSIMAPRQAGNYLFAGGIGMISLLLKLDSDRPAVTEVYRGEKGNSVYPVNSTPIVDGDVMYAVDQPGHLRCVEIATGKRLWETTEPTTGARPAGSGTAFLVKNGDRYFLFAENGDLIVAKLSKTGYQEISRAKLLEATGEAFGRQVVWSHPAFAEKCVFARNDKEIICASLAQ